MTNILGSEGKLYYNATAMTAGVLVGQDWETTGTWVEVTAARDVTNNGDADEVDVSSRGSGGHKQTRVALRDASIDFDMVWDGVITAEPGKGVDAIRAAWFAGTEITLASLDGDMDVVGHRGLVGNFVITSCSRAEPLSDAMTFAVTAKPGGVSGWCVSTTKT